MPLAAGLLKTKCYKHVFLCWRYFFITFTLWYIETLHRRPNRAEGERLHLFLRWLNRIFWYLLVVYGLEFYCSFTFPVSYFLEFGSHMTPPPVKIVDFFISIENLCRLLRRVKIGARSLVFHSQHDSKVPQSSHTDGGISLEHIVTMTIKEATQTMQPWMHHWVGNFTGN